MNSRSVTSLLLTSIFSLGIGIVSASADTGQLGANGADNSNSTGTVINNKGGHVDVDNNSVINNNQKNINNNIRKNSDDINNTSNSASKAGSQSESGAVSGSGSQVDFNDNSESHTKQLTYFQPSSQSGPVGIYQVQMQLPNGEQFIVACPTKNTNFNVGSVFVGLGYGSSSDKLPKDCVKLVQRSQQRYSMYDAMRAACHLGPGSFQSFNKHLFASSMAEIKGTTLADELRLMRTADVNVQKVSALDTYNAFCKVNMSEQKEFMPVQPPEPPYIPSTPTPTKVNH